MGVRILADENKQIRRMGYIILSTLSKRSSTDFVHASTINELLETVGNSIKRNTFYNNLKELLDKGFVDEGIMSGREKTYYITREGIEFMKGWMRK